MNDKFDDYEIYIINEKDKYDFEFSIGLNNNPIFIEEIDYTKNNYGFLLLVFFNHYQQQTFRMHPLPAYQSFALLDAS